MESGAKPLAQLTWPKAREMAQAKGLALARALEKEIREILEPTTTD